MADGEIERERRRKTDTSKREKEVGRWGTEKGQGRGRRKGVRDLRREREGEIYAHKKFTGCIYSGRKVPVTRFICIFCVSSMLKWSV